MNFEVEHLKKIGGGGIYCEGTSFIYYKDTEVTFLFSVKLFVKPVIPVNDADCALNYKTPTTDETIATGKTVATDEVARTDETATIDELVEEVLAQNEFKINKHGFYSNYFEEPMTTFNLGTQGPL